MLKNKSNCLSYWYPKIRGNVPTPETFYVKVSDGHKLFYMMDGDGPCLVWLFRPLCVMLQEAADQMGYPCFLRTGQGSGKHNWEHCCYIETASDIGSHVLNLVEWSHIVDMIGLRHDVWVVREMLPTSPLFHCQRYGNMPVVREWRYFACSGIIIGDVPYWPEDALEAGRPDTEDWRTHLEALQTEPEGGRELAERASECVEGTWSVDVLVTDDGPYVTDMALAESSWGWESIHEGGE